jgi:hypothetical protein
MMVSKLLEAALAVLQMDHGIGMLESSIRG